MKSGLSLETIRKLSADLCHFGELGAFVKLNFSDLTKLESCNFTLATSFGGDDVTALFVEVGDKVCVVGKPSAENINEYLDFVTRRPQPTHKSLRGFLVEKQVYENICSHFKLRANTEENWQGDGGLSPVMKLHPGNAIPAPSKLISAHPVSPGNSSEIQVPFAFEAAKREGRLWALNHKEYGFVGFISIALFNSSLLLLNDAELFQFVKKPSKSASSGYYLKEGLASVINQLRQVQPDFWVYSLSEPPIDSEAQGVCEDLGFEQLKSCRYFPINLIRPKWQYGTSD